MMKFLSCIWPTIMPGSNTRDFSNAKPKTMPMAMPTATAKVTDMTIPLSDASQYQHCSGDAAGKHGRDRDRGTDRQLRHTGQSMAAGAAIRDTRADQQQEAAHEGNDVALGSR